MPPSQIQQKGTKLFLIIAAILLVLGVGYLLWNYRAPDERPINTATYSCDEGKTIIASYYSSKVSLSLSDYRKLTLPQTVSASGTRYANIDESFVFWSKSNTAFIEEGTLGEQTYSNCVTADPIGGGTGDGWETYASTTLGFSIKYPQTYKVHTSYIYDQLGPGKDIHGVKFTISPSMATGTNLSSFDTGVSVESLPKETICSATAFLPDVKKSMTINENGVTYFTATSSGAAAGNFYEEIVYAIPNSKPCVAVRYFIHSTNIGNYEPGTVEEFDRTALLEDFDKMRRSFTIGN